MGANHIKLEQTVYFCTCMTEWCTLSTFGAANLPYVKPKFNDTWICRLEAGSVSTVFEYREYEINAQDGPVLFLLEDSRYFELKTASADAVLRVASVSHDCMSQVYSTLGRDANKSLEHLSLVTTSQMPDVAKELFRSSFDSLVAICGSDKTLLEKERMTEHLVSLICLAFHNGVANAGPDSHGAKTTQPYRIMSRLFELFQQPESFRHHDTRYFADKLNITTRYFFDVCRKETGMTSKQFIDDVITSEIKYRLLSETHSIQQIASDLGFEDQNAFTQYFKRNTGHTPTSFRHLHN